MSNPGGANILGYWKLDEASGSRADSHINGFTMTDGSSVGSAAGIIGNSALFVRASADYFYRAYTPVLCSPTTNFTWITWVYLNSLIANMEFVVTRTIDKDYTLYLDTSYKYRGSVGTTGGHKTIVGESYGPLPTGQWLMLHFEVELNDHISISVNNGTVDTLAFTEDIIWQNHGLVFGANVSGGYNYLDGRMDETVMFNRILTPAEITWMYNGGAGRTYSDLTSTSIEAVGISTTPVEDTPALVHVPKRVYPHIPIIPDGGGPVYVLDPVSMNTIGILEDYYSLIWTERYNEVGEFELEIPVEYDENPLVDFGNLLYIRDSDIIMIIEDIKPSIAADKSSLLIKGRSSESYLTRRVLLDNLNVDGLSEALCYALVITNFTDADDTDRNISIIKTTFPTVSITTEFKDQLKMQSVYDAIKYVCKTGSLGFKFVKDADKLAFIVYEGVDRSFDQSDNDFVIFSDNFDNVVESSFYLSEKDKINTVLVSSTIIDQYGEEEYAPSLDKVFVWYSGEPRGISRYETVLETEIKRTIKPNPPPAVEVPKIPDLPVLGLSGKHVLTAISISTSPVMGVNNNEPPPPPPEPETPLTDGEVLSIINTRGDEILETWKSVGLFEGDFDIYGNFKYGIDFFMGDIVQCDLNGRNVKARVIEMVRSYSVEGLKTYVAFDFII